MVLPPSESLYHAAYADDSSVMHLLHLHDQRLRTRLGRRYEDLIEQGRAALLMAMIAHGISSPILAAVELGVSGDLTPIVGTDDDAFAVLMQAALHILGRSSGVAPDRLSRDHCPEIVTG